ncbi:MAG: Hsp33 family molecular chaperone HslO [Betaproteobacteria bacterium]|jgi:molecular chaperone Hsp33|nr:Hsp33 family molecular chaperone HslO [Betaproteobacteria bacterium]
MSDQLHRFVFEDSAVRGEWVRLASTWQAVTERHAYPPPLRQLLGELMAAGALLAATLKFDGILSLQLQGSGPVKLIVVECTRDHAMRATAKWQGEISGGGLRELLGEGRFVVNLMPAGGQPGYQGVVGLEGDSVAAALEHYMASSEQIPTRLWLASDDRHAGGMLIQKLPEREARDADAWPRAGHLAATVSAAELLELDAPVLLRRLFHQENLRLFEPKPVCFRCTCTRERVAGMLRMLGRDEVHAIVAERGEVEVHCEFCNRRYAFDAIDSEQLFAGRGSTAAPPTRH